MDQNTERRLLIADYLSLASILRHKGLDYVEFSDEELANMRLGDLRSTCANMRDIARTPTS